MEVIKLPKKFRMVCYEIMDGKEEALTALETFADKYPHQVAAIKAEVAYFNLDYETALNLDLTVLPWLEEWYYSNVSDEHMIAMTVAAIRLHREQELIEALTKEQARIRSENGLPQRDRFCDILMDYLKRGVMPFEDNDKNYPYHEPEEPQTKEQLWQSWWNRIKSSRQTIPMPNGSYITTAVCSEQPEMRWICLRRFRACLWLTPPIETQSPVTSILVTGKKHFRQRKG